MTTTQKQNVPALRFPEFRDVWEVNSLDNLGFFTGGGTPDTNIKNYWEGDIPWISSSDIENSVLNKVRINRFINEEAIKNSATKIIPVNSVMFVSRVGIGKLAVNNVPLCTSQDFTSLTVTKGDSLFIAYMFQKNKKLLVRYSQGTSIKGFTSKELKEIKICIPKLKEQQKIAACLSSVDDLITAHTQKHEALKTYKKGLMQQLFPAEGETVPKLRFPEFSKEWKKTNIGEIADFYNGKAHENCVADSGKYLLVNSKFVSTSGRVFKKSSEQKFPLIRGDIAMVMSDVPNGKALARCFLVKEDDKYTLNQRICCFRSKEAVPEFLYIVLDRNKFYLSFDSGVTQTNLRKKEVLECPIYFPHNTEQQKIANCLSAIDDLITAHTQKLDALKAYKKGLMQQLFPATDEEI